MAEAKTPSTSDLLLLITGLYKLKAPPANPQSGKHYWLKEAGTTEDRILRDSEFNLNWIEHPIASWDSVRFRDWLIATLIQNIADHKQELKAISEDLMVSMDLLGKEFTPEMHGRTPEIKQALTAKSGRQRSYFSALSFGLSHHLIDGKDVYTFGAGMRRRVSVWSLGSEADALQADVEFFVPFYILPGSDLPKKELLSNARSICAGIMISRSNGTAIVDKQKDLVGIRFNLRIPFTTQWRSKTKEAQEDLYTDFGTPEIKIQKRLKEQNRDPNDWEKFVGWKEFLQDYFIKEKEEVNDLLNSPIGPMLPEKLSGDSGVKDIILKQKKRQEIKTQIADAQKDLDDTLYLLKHVWEWQPPKKENEGPHSTQRKLGSLLESMGFMSGKPGSGGESEYTFKLADELTVWKVVHAILNELDGFPLYVSGLSPKTERETRITLSLASQENPLAKKHYFGLAGLAYNIPLTPVPEKATKESSTKDGTGKDEEVKTPTITLSKDNFTDDKSILIEEDEEEEYEGPPERTGAPEQQPESSTTPKPPKEGPASTKEVLLHLGKWFSGESLDDNWFRRLLPKTDGGKPRVPLPGIRFLPIVREDRSFLAHNDAAFTFTLVLDLLSFGIDIKGTTKDGLTFLQGFAGHFGLGAIEIRLALKFSLEDFGKEKHFFDRVAIGVGVKLKDLRLSFGAPEEQEDGKKKKGSGNELIEGLQGILSDDWVVVPTPEKTPERTVKTRLSAKKKDKFSISVGYLFPLKEGSHGTLDIQLYDEKGTRGKLALIPIDRQLGPYYLRQIGIGLKGVENVELVKGLPDSAQLTVALTGGIRLPVFELGFIGAKLSFQLNNPSVFQFALDGLDVSIKIGQVIISGSFLKVGIEYAGSLTVDVPKASFSAMGFYGSLRVFNMSRDEKIITDLNQGNIHSDLLKKLTQNNITPRASKPIERGNIRGEWELYLADNTRYTLTDDDDKLNVLRPDKTFFVFAMLNAASGCGLTLGPIQFTGIALGYGYNRRLKVPRIENVAKFPLVQMVMGEGGFQKDEKTILNQLGKPLEDPVDMLEKMKDYLVAEAGQQFACGGVRFTISGVVDCFALLVVQWSEKEIEISLLGLARFRHTRDASARPICYVELQILMSIKPSEGTFKLQALLSNNSWIINTDCKLTGGVALFVWFDGEHKGDVVFTLGGYHPRFRRPEHYPIVPRLGLNWPVNRNLFIKGGIYFALTPSCGMLGARLEATFNSGRISAWFTAYLDVIVNWNPFYFEAEIGISLRVEASFFLTSLKVTIAASVKMWGPPVGGIAHIDLTLISFDIDFGVPRPQEPQLTKTWQEFCHNLLNMSGSDTRSVTSPVTAFPIVQPNLAAGRNGLNTLPKARQEQTQVKPEDGIWKVRADEFELAATATVPVTTLNMGRVKTSSAPEGVQDRKWSGQSIMVPKPVALETTGLRTENSANALGVYPMGKKLQSVLNVTMVRDEVSVSHAVDLTGWTMEYETGSLPAALWDAAKPNLRPTEPSAKLIAGCITGIKRLKPPSGKLGKLAKPPKIEWHPLDSGVVMKSDAEQKVPSPIQIRNIQPALAQTKDKRQQVFNAATAAGFSLSWKPAPEIRFRELQADPLKGAVAA